jgi:hypothetical protein
VDNDRRSYLREVPVRRRSRLGAPRPPRLRDGHRVLAGAGAQLPRPAQRLRDHRVELADMPERERPQQRAQGGRGHHPERQHRRGRPGAQHVGVIDVAAPGQDRGHQRQHLAARAGPADPADQPHRLADQFLHPETGHQRRRYHQPGVRHQARVVEDRFDPVDPARYSPHRKCLPSWLRSRRQAPSSSQLREALSRIRDAHQPRSTGGPRLRALSRLIPPQACATRHEASGTQIQGERRVIRARVGENGAVESTAATID